MIKPGYRTSEFWFTLVSFIFSGLYLVGLLHDNAQKEDLISQTSQGLEALILIIGQLTVLFRYIKGRNEIKKMWWSNQIEKPEPEPVPVPEPQEPEEVQENVKPRTNKKRSRKTSSKNTRKSR